MREKLIALIDDFIYDADIKKWYSEELDEKLADYLIQNGVVKVVRCEKCKHNPGYKVKEKGMAWCRKWRNYTQLNGFCNYGERRGGNEQ